MQLNCIDCNKKIEGRKDKKYCDKCVYERRKKRWRDNYHKDKKYHITRVLEWRENNKDHYKKYSKEYRTNNKEYFKNWFQNFKETSEYKIQTFIHNSKKRATKENIIEAFTTQQWQDMKKNTKGICPMCHINIGIDNITLDHIIPVSLAPKNFVYTLKDIQPMCSSCNSTKKDKINEQVKEMLKHYSINIEDIEKFKKERKHIICEECGIKAYYTTDRPKLCLVCRTKKNKERRRLYSKEYNKTYKRKIKR